jgi:RNA recognition motif-containing protein
MALKLFIGSLPWEANADTLRVLFGNHGTVRSAEVISDRDTGRSRGFGFVEMEEDSAAHDALGALNGFELKVGEGRPRRIVVELAKDNSGRSGGTRGYGAGRRR